LDLSSSSLTIFLFFFFCRSLLPLLSVSCYVRVPCVGTKRKVYTFIYIFIHIGRYENVTMALKAAIVRISLIAYSRIHYVHLSKKDLQKKISKNKKKVQRISLKYMRGTKRRKNEKFNYEFLCTVDDERIFAHSFVPPLFFYFMFSKKKSSSSSQCSILNAFSCGCNAVYSRFEKNEQNKNAFFNHSEKKVFFSAFLEANLCSHICHFDYMMTLCMQLFVHWFFFLSFLFVFYLNFEFIMKKIRGKTTWWKNFSSCLKIPRLKLMVISWAEP